MTSPKPTRKKRIALLLAGVAIGLVAVGLFAPSSVKPQEVQLSQALSLVSGGTVDSASLDDGTAVLTLTMHDESKSFARYPRAYADTLTASLLKANVTVKTAEPTVPNPLVGVLYSLVPVLLLGGLLLYLLKSGALTGNVGKLTGRRGSAVGAVPTTRFSDVAGSDEAVAQLQEMVQMITNPEKFTRTGAVPPKGALLVGPPGTGKTLLARAVAGEAGVPFFPMAGSDFVETYVGVGARRARDLFDKARQAGTAIIFIDEIDAVGRKRSGGGQGGSDSERENTLVSLLNEMDGFLDSRIVVLAATNRPDTLDPALTRPGRLDHKIMVPNPDRAGRSDILKVHLAGKPVADDVDMVSLARQTPGMSGADLAALVNEGAMEAGRRGQESIDQACLQAALASVALGRARTSALVTDHDRTLTAWHEAGHTVAAYCLPDADDPVQVTIVPRGPAGGATWMSGNDDVFLRRAVAQAKLVVALSGRAAEEVHLQGGFTQGASGDLVSATSLATQMVTQWGMGPALAVVDEQTLLMGGPAALAAYSAVEGLLQNAQTQARVLLGEQSALLEAVALALLDRETLTLDDVAQLAAGLGVAVPREDPAVGL